MSHIPAPRDGREPLPQHTTPTWEMELLISGATVFSLLQVPELLDTVFYGTFPRVGGGASAVVTLPYTYVMAATYALIATFVLHLGTRAYWVALVGLRSIHPEGIDWSVLRSGPAYREEMLRQFPNVADVVERADNRASLVFGFGIGFALALLAPLMVMLGLGAISLAVQQVTAFSMSWGTAWLVVAAVFFTPFLVALLVDRWMGNRLAPEGRPARAVRALLRGYLHARLGGFTNYPTLLFYSRFGQHRSSMIMMLAVFAVLGLVFVRLAIRENTWHLDGYVDLPSIDSAPGRALDPLNYADQRDGLHSLRPRAYIQSEIIEGDYVRLFIPYSPQRHAAAMARVCDPATAALADGKASSSVLSNAEQQDADSATAHALLACMTRIHDVNIDGRPVRSLVLDFSSEPRLGLRGFVGMIDVSALPRGRHVLELGMSDAARAPVEDGENAKRRPPQKIVFWR